MINEIPNKPNHKIVGYKEIKPCNDNLPILYEPIYERIFPLNTVYWDKSRNERIYLTSDSRGFDCEGNFIKIDTNQLEIPSKADQEMFYEFLSHNGYEFKDGKLAIHLEIGRIYISSYGQIVMYLSDGCHTCKNEIFNSILQEPADEVETTWFFDHLKSNGFTYNPVDKCITKLERYYYFPSYSLYSGFQPKKKKWINSDVDKFYDRHFETFNTFNDCACWCNIINEELKRDYPKIKLEE